MASATIMARCVAGPVLLLLPVLALVAAAGSEGCTLAYTKSSYVPQLNIRIPVCTALQATGAPIRVPTDSNGVKYGQLQFSTMSVGPTGGGGMVGGAVGSATVGGGGVVGGAVGGDTVGGGGAGRGAVDGAVVGGRGVGRGAAGGAVVGGRRLMQVAVGGTVVGGDGGNGTASTGDQSPTDGSSAPQIQVTANFVDRDGVLYPVPAAALPANASTLDSLQNYAPQLLIKARLRRGNITSFSLAMFVPFSTMLGPLRNTSFIGNVSNLSPARGIPDQQFFRWDFGSTIVTTDSTKLGTQLQGQFVNMYSGVRYGGSVSGTCQPAMCASKDLCAYYTQFFGDSPNMTLYWNPNMHAAQDTELVPLFSSGIGYMTHWVQLYQLLKPYTFYQTYQFVIHGNPVATPSSFTGVLSKTTSKPVLCNTTVVPGMPVPRSLRV